MPTSPGPLLQSLYDLWGHLRHTLPELPPARIIVASSPAGDHSAARWRREEDGAVSSIIVDTETLRRGDEAVLTSLLHDAAHILCWQRGDKDTSTTGGAYHNATYLAAAEEVGLEWPPDRTRGPRGYADPQPSAVTIERFAESLKTLSGVIPEALPHLDVPSSTRPKRTPRLALTCDCDTPRKIWTARTTEAAGPIVCGVCMHPFTPE
ncbi:hypothetical protein NPS70_16475 [Streptomyces sp. C10-9-1]|uniref:hypothetical protein n=1 Tax=Streptomyces sp. C10-9-1 TaxID=1859285 RepID=UPI0021136BDC|nr:hypothetical protein [Streptomyces sp. C10-9-1]MCQ6554782.1 hypothetical protein [Streptomyces sp. C10-9-1]